MSDRSGRRPVALDDAGLETAIRALSASIDWPTGRPTAGPDVASRVRARLVARGPGRPIAGQGWRPASLPRALALALLALLALAAVAGAVGLGLPGLRLILGGPATATPTTTGSPSATAASGSPGADRSPGANLGLGRATTLEAARSDSGVPIRLPSDPAIGPPDAVYVDRTRSDQVALVWAVRPALPVTNTPGVGLIVMAFDGTHDSGYFTKVIDSGTVVEPVVVDGHRGYWLEGDPHMFFYQGRTGFVDDPRRWVGDALIWSDGSATYRIESALGRDATLALAGSLD